jgi:predicted nucleic acid-binding protein
MAAGNNQRCGGGRAAQAYQSTRDPALRELLEGLTIHEDSLPVAGSVSNMLPLAREYGLSAYDASYLEVAIRNGAALATLDGGLEKAGRKAGVEIVAVPRSPKLKR